MTPKEFNKISSDHVKASKGMKYKTIKPHHEVLGDLEEGVILELDSIAHFPTRYRLRSDDGKLWTVPTHTVEMVPND